MNIEAQITGNQNRRMATEARYLDRREMLEAKAERLIGELVREGRDVYYINLMDTKGNLTGKVKESASFFELVDYLVRNGYVA
jgi:hypothetical protein